jgi:hypothetical protein
MDIKTGDIILVKGKGFVSDIIEDVEHSKYSHTAIYINRNIIIEAQGFEVTNYANISKYKGQADAYRYQELVDTQRIIITKYLNRQIGTKYNWWLLVWELLRYKLHILLPFKGEFHCHICSTLAVDAYRNIGIFLCPGIKYPSPGDIGKSKLLKKIGTI